MEKQRMKENMGILLFGAIAFAFFVAFFSTVHPIVISDTDDWLYSYEARNAIPIVHLWNPTRVLPEILMPFVTRICAYGIYPFFKSTGIFHCLTVTYAITVSLFQLLLLFQLSKLLKHNNMQLKEILAYLAFYILAGFWVFRSSSDSPNIYALHSLDACTYFYYVIPNLLACGIVCYMIYSEENGIKHGLVYSNIEIVAVYLCLFSNLFSSIILAVYVGTSLLFEIIKVIKTKSKSWKEFFASRYWKLIILSAWAVSQVMEATGGRADYNYDFGNYQDCLIETTKLLFGLVKTVNKACFISFVIIAVSGLIVLFRNGEKRLTGFIAFGALNAILIITYEIMLCAKVQPNYIQRFDVIYGGFFWLMIIEIFSLYVISKKYKPLKSLYLLALIIILFNCETVGKTYKESMVRQDLEPEAAYQICDDIIEQLQEIDRNNSTEVTVFVPEFDGPSNRPYGTYAGQRFAEFAYAYGLTSNRLKVIETVATTEKNYLLNGGLSN